MDPLFSHEYTVPVLLAGLGGFMLNMMNLYQDQKRPKSERTDKGALFWVMFVFWPFAGAVLSFVYLLDGSTLRPILAFTIGITAPTTLQAMLKASTDESPAEPDRDVEE